MKPSKYQQDVFTLVVTTNKNAAIKAGPGSGKSTTLVEAAKLIPYNKTAIFVAFNKAIVTTLKTKLPDKVDCFTLHSIGMRCIRGHYGGETSLYKTKQISYIEKSYEERHRGEEKINLREKWSTVYAIDRVMSLCRANMSKPSQEEIQKVLVNYSLDLDDDQVALCAQALHAFYDYNDDPDRFNITIDFQDMVELCVRNQNIKMPQYDFVFVDEMQDFSELDHLFVRRLKKVNGGRIIGVGDPKQSIYGFRGSHPRSFDMFANEPNTTVLPLSISYRCAKDIVKHAKLVYPDVEEYEENEKGEVRLGNVKEIKEGDMVLCRNTRPLFSVFFELIDHDKKAFIVGKEMEKGLKQVLGCCEPSDTKEIALGKLDNHVNKVHTALKAKGIAKPQNHAQSIALCEKVDILRLLFTRFSTVYDVERWIERVFEDDEEERKGGTKREGVKLLTIHKSKGLECDRVFIIETFENKWLIPSPYAVTSDQKIQEKNLLFVAYTRAKKQLIKLRL